MTCCGFGHRVLLMDVEKPLREVLERLVEEQGVTEFFTGGIGEFDALFSKTVRSLKRDHPGLRLILVVPYLTSRLNADKAFLRTQYDEIIIPAELDGVHPKKAIGLRNRWMIDQSDYVVAALRREDGGAAAAVKYAKEKRKRIVELETPLSCPENDHKINFNIL